MLRLSGILPSLAGAWAVMNGDAAGLRRFDLSIDGFWRSFGAIVLIVPIAILATYSEEIALAAEGASDGVVTGGFLVLRMIALFVDWVAFPLLFAALARPLGLAGQYVPFIIARNWSEVIVSAGFGVLHLLHLAGVLPATIWLAGLMALFLVALRFSYMIVRTVLAVPVGLAIPIVLLQPLISLLIELGFNRLGG